MKYEFTEFTEEKKSARETVQQAILLHKADLIDANVLRAVIASALAWEISETFEHKFLPKMEKIEDWIFQ